MLSNSIAATADLAGKRLEQLTAGVVAAGCSLAVGWIAATPLGGLFIAIVVLPLVVLAVIARLNFGVAIALLVGAVLNAIPGIDLEQFTQKGSFRVSDVVIVTLIGLLALRHVAGQPDTLPAPWLRRAHLWSFVFLSWWLVTLIRTHLFDDVPLLRAALFGRDFLYFGILFPLILGALRTRREVIGTFATLAVLGVLYAIGHLGVVVGLEGFRPLVHETLETELGSVTRIYAFAGDLALALFALGAGLVLLSQERRPRVLGTWLALLSGASVLLSFTRAAYAGLFLAFLFAGAVWSARHGQSAARLRRAGLVAAGCIVLVVAALNSYRPPAGTPGTAVSPSASPAELIRVRAASGFEEVSGKTGTVGYRYQVAREMFRVLDGRWIQGLGFWHPDAKPVVTLPERSIRNGDVGLLNGVMTIGIIGTALVYLPLFVVVAALLRLSAREGRGRNDWFHFGLLAWLVSVIVSSVTLVTLFATTGLVLTACLLACGVRMLAFDRAPLDRPAPAPAGGAA